MTPVCADTAVAAFGALREKLPSRLSANCERSKRRRVDAYSVPTSSWWGRGFRTYLALAEDMRTRGTSQQLCAGIGMTLEAQSDHAGRAIAVPSMCGNSGHEFYLEPENALAYGCRAILPANRRALPVKDYQTFPWQILHNKSCDKTKRYGLFVFLAVNDRRGADHEGRSQSKRNDQSQNQCFHSPPPSRTQNPLSERLPSEKLHCSSPCYGVKPMLAVAVLRRFHVPMFMTLIGGPNSPPSL
jgi:hypothetical protein